MVDHRDTVEGTSTIWVITEPTLDQAEQQLQQYAGTKKLSADKLGELLQDFTTSLSEALDRVQTVSDSFELNEVTIHAQLMGEIGFALVAKGGAEAGVELKFARK